MSRTDAHVKPQHYWPEHCKSDWRSRNNTWIDDETTRSIHTAPRNLIIDRLADKTYGAEFLGYRFIGNISFLSDSPIDLRSPYYRNSYYFNSRLSARQEKSTPHLFIDDARVFGGQINFDFREALDSMDAAHMENFFRTEVFNKSRGYIDAPWGVQTHGDSGYVLLRRTELVDYKTKEEEYLRFSDPKDFLVAVDGLSVKTLESLRQFGVSRYGNKFWKGSIRELPEEIRAELKDGRRISGFAFFEGDSHAVIKTTRVEKSLHTTEYNKVYRNSFEVLTGPYDPSIESQYHQYGLYRTEGDDRTAPTYREIDKHYSRYSGDYEYESGGRKVQRLHDELDDWKLLYNSGYDVVEEEGL